MNLPASEYPVCIESLFLFLIYLTKDFCNKRSLITSCPCSSPYFVSKRGEISIFLCISSFFAKYKAENIEIGCSHYAIKNLIG